MDLEAEVTQLKEALAENEAALADNRRRTRRLSLVNALLAVVVLAFGGVGAAYALAPANSVNSASIVDRSIGTPDVKVGAFAGQTILDNSMTTKDINEATLVLTCPSGMLRVGDVCYTGSQRAAAIWSAALTDCNSDKLRLPTIPEALAVGSALGSNTNLWAASWFNDGAKSYGHTANNQGSSVADITAGQTRPYRCVTTVGARP